MRHWPWKHTWWRDERLRAHENGEVHYTDAGMMAMAICPTPILIGYKYCLCGKRKAVTM